MLLKKYLKRSNTGSHGSVPAKHANMLLESFRRETTEVAAFQERPVTWKIRKSSRLTTLLETKFNRNISTCAQVSTWASDASEMNLPALYFLTISSLWHSHALTACRSRVLEVSWWFSGSKGACQPLIWGTLPRLVLQAANMPHFNSNPVISVRDVSAQLSLL